jgi:hypothetical protein
LGLVPSLLVFLLQHMLSFAAQLCINMPLQAVRGFLKKFNVHQKFL